MESRDLDFYGWRWKATSGDSLFVRVRGWSLGRGGLESRDLDFYGEHETRLVQLLRFLPPLHPLHPLLFKPD